MEKVKTFVAICTILLLFPYITVTLSGHERETTAFADEELLEQWVLEILPGQMPISYEPEALKAQAILVRSNLMYYMERDQKEISHVTDTTVEAWGLSGYSYEDLQELWNREDFEAYYGKIYSAVEETRGKVLQYEGRYVDIPYHAVSAGKTRSGELLGENYGYLQAVECSKEVEAENFVEIKRLDITEPVEILSLDDSGYVLEVKVGETHMAGEVFRNTYGLSSGCFSLQQEKEALVAVAKGLGHGFGMSLYQAQRMAEEGADCFNILNYFYENLTVRDLSEK